MNIKIVIGLIVVLLIFLLAGLGIGIMVAQNSMPADMLYPVKLVSEDIRSSLTSDPYQRLELELSFEGKRFDEIVALIEQEQIPPEDVRIRMQAHIDYILQIASSQDQLTMQTILERLQSNIQSQDQILVTLLEEIKIPQQLYITETRAMLQSRLQLIEIGLTNPANFIASVNPSAALTSQPADQQNTTASTPVPTAQPHTISGRELGEIVSSESVTGTFPGVPTLAAETDQTTEQNSQANDIPPGLGGSSEQGDTSDLPPGIDDTPSDGAAIAAPPGLLSTPQPATTSETTSEPMPPGAEAQPPGIDSEPPDTLGATFTPVDGWDGPPGANTTPLPTSTPPF